LARESAAGLWAVRRWSGDVHAIGPRSRRGEGFVLHRTRSLPPEDVTVHWGIPVTTPLRTLLDLSRRLPIDALDAALAEALVRKLITIEDLQARATGNLARLVSTAAPTRSRLERDFRRLLREHGLPQPVSNRFVCGHEVDLHWPDRKLVVEIDGYGIHGHRRAFETDRVRDQQLLLAGWKVARVTDRQMTDLRADTAHRFTCCSPRSPPSRPSASSSGSGHIRARVPPWSRRRGSRRRGRPAPVAAQKAIERRRGALSRRVGIVWYSASSRSDPRGLGA
jgi:very-short-patch-repair endonuclease